jgi:hypothetical protein
MTKRAALLVVFVLFAALCGMGSTKAHRGATSMGTRRMSVQNQFHFAPTQGRGKLIYDRMIAGLSKGSALPGSNPQVTAGVHGQAKQVHRHSNPPVSSIGFVSAAQIPAGGGVILQNHALAGDFNGDGVLDVATLVANGTGGAYTYSLSVVLSNGDGTFKPPVLTATAGNQSDPFMVGDVDGDGWDDIIVAHQAGTNGNVNSSFDVLISNGDGTFKAPVNYSITANFLSGGTLADMDGDGILDLVAVDSATPGNLWVVQGMGGGIFSSTPTSSALSGPVGYDVVFADLNGDGLLDITANDSTSGVQTVFLATAPGVFAPGATFDTADGVHDACSTTVGDLNGDGFPEIVNANCGDNNITIFVNDEHGSFPLGGTYYVPGVAAGAGGIAASNAFLNPIGVTVADLNGDGFGDVISTNNAGGDVTVLLSNGDGTVQTPTFGFTTGGHLSVEAMVADLNGDGLADIIVPDGEYSLVYMKGYGDGTFRAAMDYYTPASDNGEPFGFDIATGDFNGDGLPDVVVGNQLDAAVGITVFLSRPDGSMQPGVNYGLGGGMAHVAVADLDGDGVLDIVATDSTTGMLRIFSGNKTSSGVGDGTFTEGGSFATDAGNTDPRAVVVGDFNGDGKPDLAVANYGGSNVAVLLNQGGLTFAAPVTYSVCSPSLELTAADLNGDGFPDLVVPLTQCGAVQVFMNTADGTGGLSVGTIFLVGNNPYQVAVGDLDGDGIPDLAITIDDYAIGHGIAVALGLGGGTFQPANTPAYPSTLQGNFWQSPFPAYVKMVDLDGDGHLDLVYTNETYGSVGVMYGLGNGQFFDPVEYPTARESYGLALADVNGDGAVDVVTAGFNTSGVTTLLNNSGSKLLPDYAVSANPPSATVTAGSSATYTITVSPNNFYNGTISFACGTLPSKTACAFGPVTLTPNGNGQMTTTLTVTTTAASFAMVAPAQIREGTPMLWAGLGGLGVFGLMLAGDWKKKRIRWMGVLLGILLLGMMFLVGCGGSSYTPPPPVPVPGTPTGTYPIQVTATGTAGTNGGNTSPHNLAPLSLTVQ